MLAARTARSYVRNSNSTINSWVHLASTLAPRRGINLFDRHARRCGPSSIFIAHQHQHPPQIARGPQTFRGLTIPEKALPPTADECCMSRCDICVYDIYLTSLRVYREDISAARHSLETMRVPLNEWPVQLRLEAELDARDCEAEKRAVTEMAMRRPHGATDSSEWWAKEVWIEAARLTLWVLRGCKG